MRRSLVLGAVLLVFVSLLAPQATATTKFQLGPATCLFHDRGMFREAPTVSGTITGLVEPFGTFTYGKISDQSSTRLSHGGECSR